jgi:hypothetical protein
MMEEGVEASNGTGPYGFKQGSRGLHWYLMTDDRLQEKGQLQSYKAWLKADSIEHRPWACGISGP